MLVVAISTRALFNFSEGNKVFEKDGLSAYKAYQREFESQALEKGVCYNLVKKLLNLNINRDKPVVEVILCSRNSADSGLRVFNSIEHYGLAITRAIFSDGQPVYQYLKAYKVDLFLSANAVDVADALKIGIAAATILTDKIQQYSEKNPQLRVAFDADCVLFSDEIEKINQQHGLDAFIKNEKQHAHIALPQGPFSSFIRGFSKMQQALSDKSLIRTALVTARSAPAHERVIRTLRSWNVTIDESFFLGNHDKSNVLSVYEPDIFFDDRLTNCTRSAEKVPTGHVPYGVTNQE